MNRPMLKTYDVQNAIRRAKTMRESGEYEIKPLEFEEEGRTGWSVQHKEDFTRGYFVETTPGAHKCTCPQFEKAGVCKHEYFATDYEEEQGINERTAHRAAAAIGAGFFDTTDAADRAAQMRNIERLVEYHAHPFNDRIY